MKRVLLAACLAAAILFLAPTSSSAFDPYGRCSALDRRIVDDNPASPFVTATTAQFTISARMYGGEPLAEWTYVTCELRPFSAADPVVWSKEDSLLKGPIGLFMTDLVFNGPPLGTPWYLCTRVRTVPSGTVTHHGCTYAFTV